MSARTILVTGGLGFIGSHTAVELIEAGYQVVILDNLVNSELKVLENIEQITGQKPKFYQADVLNYKALSSVFQDNKIDAVIHFAALKSVGESLKNPIEYYKNNIGGLLSLVEVMNDSGVRTLVFSSSATVYGAENESPVSEDALLGKALNPYGQTKIMGEQILTDLNLSDPSWNVTLLRYFNPVGSHSSGLLGDNPSLPPTNLMPILMRVASGELEELQIFGDDYPTVDGTAVRDYIHVVDLAKGHIAALNNSDPRLKVYNLGTGNGYSVRQMLETFEDVNNLKLKFKIAPRRDGDLAISYSNPAKAERELGWKAKLNLEDMCSSAWNFYKKAKNLSS
jgi:UDP-glucose 4-epimerase